MSTKSPSPPIIFEKHSSSAVMSKGSGPEVLKTNTSVSTDVAQITSKSAFTSSAHTTPSKQSAASSAKNAIPTPAELQEESPGRVNDTKTDSTKSSLWSVATAAPPKQSAVFTTPSTQSAVVTTPSKPSSVFTAYSKQSAVVTTPLKQAAVLTTYSKQSAISTTP